MRTFAIIVGVGLRGLFATICAILILQFLLDLGAVSASCLSL